MQEFRDTAAVLLLGSIGLFSCSYQIPASDLATLALLNSLTGVTIADDSAGGDSGGGDTTTSTPVTCATASLNFQTVTQAGNWSHLAYGNGMYVAIRNLGTSTITSTDGINWSAGTIPAGFHIGLDFANGLFISGDDSGVIKTSSDAATWNTPAPSMVDEWRAFAYGNGTYVGVNNGLLAGCDYVMTSPDAVTWTGVAPATAPQRSLAVIFAGNQFVAVGNDGTRAMTSPDGVNWTQRTVPALNWVDVTYGGGLYVAVAASTGTNTIVTSPDGITWTTRTSPETNGWTSVAYGDGLFVAVTSSGTNRVMTSTDGINWTSNTTASADTWRSVTHNNGRFVAVGTNAVMYANCE